MIPTPTHSPAQRHQSAIPAFVMGTLCIVGGVTGYARTRSIPSIVAGFGYALPWYLCWTILTLRPPVVSVLSICTAGIASASTQQTDSRQHLVSTSFPSLSKCSIPNDPSLRCLGSFIPILSPKVCQGSDSGDAHCHICRDWRILRPGDIQATSVGGGWVSPHKVGTCHCSDFCIICKPLCTTLSPRMNSALLSVSVTGCTARHVWQSLVRDILHTQVYHSRSFSASRG